MKQTKKTYWKGLEQLSNDPEFVKNADREFAELPSSLNEDGSATRRDFLKLMGFSLAAASLAACETPIRKAIPYVNKPIDINPSIPNYYASTYSSGGDYASIVVKTREGRPIKIEGNELSPITKGKVNAIVEASVLSLYDKQRVAGPMLAGAASDWAKVDAHVKSKLAAAGTVKIVTNTILSPSTEKALQEFSAAFGEAEVVVYDSISNYGITKASEVFYGQAILPS